jgi:glucosamine kinase
MQERVGLGLDAGGTGTRWVLATERGILTRGEIGPISGHMLLADSETKVELELERLVADIRPFQRPTSIFAGVTGTSAGSRSSKAIEAILASMFSVPADFVKVTTDLWITYHACFRPGEGIVVYCGTGSAAVHVTADGTEILVGGLGHLIDDAGSGFWIGQSAVREILRAEQQTPGSGWSPPMGRRIAAVLGDGTWPAVRAYVYGGDRASLALLAPAVGQAARLDDDDGARGILLDAGKELGRLVNTLRARVGRFPFALTGRAGSLPYVAEGLGSAVGETVSPKTPDAALAAARLSLEQVSW